jgi:hypothetical protein
MRKAYAAGGMIVRSATRGGGNSGGSSSGNGKGGSSSKQADEPNSNSAAVAIAGGGGNSPANKSPAPETSPVVVTKADPALLAAIKNGRIRGRNHQGNPQQQQQQQRHHHHHHNQPPPDVMNLTAKNYRLAKELVSPIVHGCNGLIRSTRGSLRSHARRVLLLCLFLLCFLA